MISMQLGLAATASLNWLIIVPGSHCEYWALRLMPSAAAAALAPFSRASVAPSPDAPPIWIYIVSPFPSGSSASAGATIAANAAPAKSNLLVVIGFLALVVVCLSAAPCCGFRSIPGRLLTPGGARALEASEQRAAPLRFVD